MIKLKSKIKIIESLPPEEKKKTSITTIIFSMILIIILMISIYLGIKTVLPYINAIKVEKIIGKKTSITECNTKDYVIIEKDKQYTMNITDNNCITNYYEGNIIIKNNEIIFNKNIKGTIDNNYNIIINNNIFESDKNE